MMNVNSTTTHTISGLVPFVDYSVTVAAVSINGTGPFSNPVVGRSGEDSELNYLFSVELYRVPFYVIVRISI